MVEAERDPDWRADSAEEVDEESENDSKYDEEECDREAPELGKNTTVNAKEGGWYFGEKNPDYRLAQIHASNQGFQSKIRSDIGSYVISKMVDKIKTNIESNKKFFYQILDEIQNELELSGKQLPVHIFFNGTGYIKFIKRESESLMMREGIKSDQHQSVKEGIELAVSDKILKDEIEKPSLIIPTSIEDDSHIHQNRGRPTLLK